jgi:AcrR family transcriptional regulator
MQVPGTWNSILTMQDVVSSLADRALADRHDAYTAEIRRLLDAALAVMRRDETLEPRVGDIVREAGLSNQAFYRHFRGKDELLLALLEDGRRRLVETIERRIARAEPGAPRVRAWILAVFAQAQDDEAAAATRPFAINGERLSAEFPDEAARSRDLLLDPLRAAIDQAGGDGARDAAAVYHVAMGTVHDALVARRAPARAEIDHVVEFALRGIGIGT